MPGVPYFPLSPHSLSLQLTANSPRGTLLDTGKVFQLEFNNNLLDSSDSADHQTDNIQNGPLAFTTDRVNGSHAASWDADSSQYIRPSATNLGGHNLFTDATTHLTVGVWINNNDPTGGIGMILSRRMESTGFRLQVTNTGVNVTFRGQLNSFSTSGLDDGEWHHVAVTWDGSEGLLYVDGVVEETAIVNGTDDEDDTSEGAQEVFIGAADSIIGGLEANLVLFFDELMDDLTIWNRALSADEIATLAGV